jgi:nucleotide-binding universal stress UspA family protein
MTSTGTPGSVVVGVDGSKNALGAARWAAGVADRFGLPLTIVDAVPDLRDYYPTKVAADREAVLAALAQAALNEAEDTVRADFGTLPIETTPVQSRDKMVSDTLVALSPQARFFVVGCDDVSPAGALFVDSETLRLTMHAACPVIAWRGDVASPDTRPILLGVDGVNGAPIALAFEFAHRFNAPLVAARAWSMLRQPGDVTNPLLLDWDVLENDQKRIVGEALAPWRRRYPTVEVTAVLEAVSPGRLLVQHARDAQLVVVGRSRRGLVASALLGSATLNLLHHSPTPVMVCPPEKSGPR